MPSAVFNLPDPSWKPGQGHSRAMAAWYLPITARRNWEVRASQLSRTSMRPQKGKFQELLFPEEKVFCEKTCCLHPAHFCEQESIYHCADIIEIGAMRNGRQFSSCWWAPVLLNHKFSMYFHMVRGRDPVCAFQWQRNQPLYQQKFDGQVAWSHTPLCLWKRHGDWWERCDLGTLDLTPWGIGPLRRVFTFSGGGEVAVVPDFIFMSDNTRPHTASSSGWRLSGKWRYSPTTGCSVEANSNLHS